MMLIIGAQIDPNDQANLVAFYNQLTSTGNLNWNISADLCLSEAKGVYCDTRVPNRVYRL